MHIPYNKIYHQACDNDLVNVGVDVFKRELFLEKETYKAWVQMQKKALSENIKLNIVSGFRSYKYQENIITKKLARGISLEQITKAIALPGMSEHHTGRAIDIATDCMLKSSDVLCEDFEKTDAFAWLEKHAYKYNFKMSFEKNNSQGFIYEPWHWYFEKK